MALKIIYKNHSIYCNKGCWKHFTKVVEKLKPSKFFIICDTQTQKNCLPYFLTKTALNNFKVITIMPGEKNKNIKNCVNAWQALSQYGADRKSLVINLGGGVVTDLGGFVASTYRRGINFINIPTSLLAMVDAALGGKNGVDLGVLKNQIGAVKLPLAIIIDTHFLKTLPKKQLKSGQAEVIKHGMITSELYLKEAFSLHLDQLKQTEKIIWESVLIKTNIVQKDPLENDIRKTLNFGHTLGHAIESYFLQNKSKTPLLHGEAIAIGMVLATYISYKIYHFPFEKLQWFTQLILMHYPKINISKEAEKKCIDLLKYDKKNSHGNIQFVLLEAIGVYKLHQNVKEEIIIEAFNFYKNFAID